MTGGILCIYQAFGYTLEHQRVGTVPVPRVFLEILELPSEALHMLSPSHTDSDSISLMLGKEIGAFSSPVLAWKNLLPSFCFPFPNSHTLEFILCVCLLPSPVGKAFKVLPDPKMKSNRRSRKYQTLRNNLDNKTSMAVLLVVLSIARNLRVNVVSETSFKSHS